MKDRPHGVATRGPRRLFIEPGTDDAVPALLDGEFEHAVRVLRLAAGDRVTGMDGRGGWWPLAIEHVGRASATLARAGDPVFEPRPGDPGARLPWIECAVALPRAARAEEMLDRLTQLGVAAIAPIVWRRSTPEAQSDAASRRQRFARILRSSCKQCGRAWLPELLPLQTAEELAGRACGADLVMLAERASGSLADWVRTRTERLAESRGSEWAWRVDRPLTLVVGPEGGFEADELARLEAAGATFASVAPHTMRVETAA